jgi:hypothetical protein
VALTGSAHVWFAGDAQRTSPVCFFPRSAQRGSAGSSTLLECAQLAWRTTIRTTSTISAASRSMTKSSFSNMTTTTSRCSMAPKIQVTQKKQHASSRSCSRTNTEDAVFLWSLDKSPNPEPPYSTKLTMFRPVEFSITPDGAPRQGTPHTNPPPFSDDAPLGH